MVSVHPVEYIELVFYDKIIITSISYNVSMKNVFLEVTRVQTRIQEVVGTPEIFKTLGI